MTVNGATHGLLLLSREHPEDLGLTGAPFHSLVKPLDAHDELMRVATACERALSHWTDPKRSKATFGMDVYEAKQLMRLLQARIARAQEATP